MEPQDLRGASDAELAFRLAQIRIGELKGLLAEVAPFINHDYLGHNDETCLRCRIEGAARL